MKRIAIIGGGLTGLSTAYYLGKARPDLLIDVYEQAPQPGGKIQTKRIDGFVVELGPDSYLGRKVEMTNLINDLGLGHTLLANATGQAYVYDKGETHPIPGGSIMGVPTEMMPFVKSTLISWPGKIRAAMDFFRSPYKLDAQGDVSIGHFFHYHLGQEMMDKLIEPLLSGIYGGDIYKISLLSTFSHFIDVEQKYGNMVKGMMAAKMSHKKAGVEKASKGPAMNEGDVPTVGKDTMTDAEFKACGGHKIVPMSVKGESLKQNGSSQVKLSVGTAYQSGMFRQLSGGLASVINQIVEKMPGNVTLHTNTLVTDLKQEADFTYEVTTVVRGADKDISGEVNANISVCDQDGEISIVDTVIITTPPATYKSYFQKDPGFDPIRDMEQSTCAIAIMAFDKATFDGDLKGSGLLITRHTDTPLTACTNLSQKWPQTTPSDKVVLRVFIGKPGDTTVDDSSEDELRALAVSEIQRIMGFTSKPLWVEINRLVNCMPQYNVGHRANVQFVRHHIEKHYPSLYVIGTPFDGIGIPDGVKQGKELVDQLVDQLVD